MFSRSLGRNFWLASLVLTPFWTGAPNAFAQNSHSSATDSSVTNASATNASATASTPSDSSAVSLSDAPQEIVLPSALPSGNALNDRLIFVFTPARHLPLRSGPTPAVVLLHQLGASSNREMLAFARYLAERGVASATITLPYHMKRLPPGDAAIHHFVASNAETVVQAFDQSAADVSAVVSYLAARPDVDASKISAIGISLGALVTHLTMGRDARLASGVAIVGGGDLADIYRHSVLGRFVVKPRVQVTPADEALLRTVDPLSFAGQNQPRRVLMIQAARDFVIPPRDAQELWQALGKPPIRWVDVNHFGLRFAPRAVQKASLKYLQSVWNGAPLTKAPKLTAPTLKFGLISGLDALVSPAATLQVFSLGTRRDHLSIAHADVGITGRGPFAAVAATVTQFVDLGVGRRLNGDKLRPYFSFHVAY